MSKNLSLKEPGPSYGQRFVCSDNPGKKYLEVKKFNKVEQDLKSVLSNFFLVLWLLLLKFNFWALGYVFSQIWKFPYFLRSYVLSRSATREVTRIPSLLY